MIGLIGRGIVRVEETRMSTIEPYALHVDDRLLDDLRQRLARTRWPDEPEQPPPWQAGTSLAYLRELLRHWHDAFDWREHERLLNSFRQFTAPVGGARIHFIHEPGRGPDPMPLLISHGWPGSVFEFLELIPRLVDPARYGGDPADAFTVVAPSLPGYTLSFQPGQPRYGAEEIADAYAVLMSDRLGYARYGTQGGDWGAFVTSRLAWCHPERLIGLHLNFLPLWRDAAALGAATEEEQAYRRALELFLREEAGYQAIQGTRPQTLAYALNDSPAGLAAWMAEKFRAWTDCGGDPARAVPVDRMLANITLYWVTGCIGASFAPYYLRAHRPWPIPEGQQVRVPMGYAQFPHEILRPPRSLAAKMFADIRRWEAMPRGGHFAALEQPELLAQEIRAFFRPLRG